MWKLADDEVPAGDCSLHGSKLTSLELALMSEVYWFMKIWPSSSLAFNIFEGDFVWLAGGTSGQSQWL